MSKPLRVLILEDRQSDAELMIHELRRAGFEPAWRVVGDEAGYLAHLDPAPDVILADYTLPQFDAERALQLLQARRLDIPFIVVTGSISEEVAVACMKQGAADYLLKDRLARLGPAVIQALEQHDLRQKQRQAEAALRRSEQRYRQLVESSPDGIAVHSEGKLVFINSAGARLLGAASPEELLGRTVLDLVHPDYRPLVRERIQQLLAQGGRVPFLDQKLIRADGSVIDVEATATAITYQDRPAARVVLRDITERKQAERQLRLQAAALEAVANGIVITDRDGTILWANPAFSQLTGYSLAELPGHTPRLLKSGWHGEDFYREMWETILAGRVWQGELVNRRKDGSLYSEEASITPVRDEGGEITHFVAIKQDITARKQAEQALHETNELLQAMFEASPMAIIVLDPDGRVTLWSPAAEQTFGWQADEVLGRPHPLVPEGRRAEFQVLFQAVMNGHSYSNLETQRLRADGSIIDVSLASAPLRDAEGNVLGAVRILADITERKVAEQARQRYAQRLETLLDISRAILAAETLLEIADVALHRLLGLIPCRLARVGLPDLDRQQARIITGQLEGDTPRLTEARLPLTDLDLKELARVLESLQQSEVFEFEDLQALAALPPLLQPLQVQGLRSYLALPLIAADELVGVLSLGRAEPGRFAAEEVEVAREIANLLAIAIRHVQFLEAERAYRRQLHDLTEYLHTAREEERTAIAREIHDELGQALTALKIDLAWIARRLPQEKGALTAKAKEMSVMLDSSMKMVQRIATELRPGVLDDLGLMAALEWQVRDCARRTGLACQLQLPEEDLALDRHLATALFRIVQETLTNVTRHAAAKRVWVTLASRPEELRLVIRDDGRGISEAQIRAPTSLGLIGMRERVRPWNGAVTFEGVPGQGTTVTVRIPETRRRGGSYD